MKKTSLNSRRLSSSNRIAPLFCPFAIVLAVAGWLMFLLTATTLSKAISSALKFPALWSTVSAQNPSSTLYLHGTGPSDNPPSLFLNTTSPTATTEKFKDSTSINRNGGNPWKEVGVWPAAPAMTIGNLVSLNDLHVWLGLKNSDDQGTYFDLKVEAYKNSTLVASGQSLCITGITRNPTAAKEVVLGFNPFSPVSFNGASDVLKLKVLTRVGTTAAGGSCGGHNNAVGLRLYFDAVARASRFSAVNQSSDTTPPVLTVDQPVENAITGTTQINVTGTFTDQSATTITVNGATTTLQGNNFTATAPLIEGQNSLLVVATDAAGNHTDVTRHVVRDTMPPSVAVQEPTANLVTNSSQINVSGTFDDATATTIKVNNVDATLAGNSFSASVPLAEGANGLNVVAIDAAGNQGTASRNITRDTTVPTIAISEPSDGAFTKNLETTVTGTFSDATATTVTVNGIAATISGSGFSAVVAVDEGPNTLTITATDAAGNHSEATRSITRDTGSPEVLVEQPYDGSFTNSSNVTVTGTIADANAVSLTVNGVSAAIADGRFTISVPLNPGTNILSVLAVDAAANQIGVPLTVNLVSDNSPPSITVTSPTNGAVSAENTVSVSGTAADDLPITLTVNNVTLHVATDGQFAGIVHVPSGSNQLTFVAQDAVGNQSQVVRSLVVDAAPPVISNLTPADGTTIQSQVATIEGQISDATTVSVTVSGINAVLNPGNIFEASGVGISEGVNNLVIEAIDQAGNRSTVGLVINGGDVTPPAPPVFLSIKPATRLAFQTLEGHAEPGATIRISGGVEPISAQAAGGSGLFAAHVNLSVGPNSLSAIAEDAAGNSSSPVTFTISSNPNAPPPPAGQSYQINVSTGSGQRGLNGAELPRPLIALVTDRLGDPVPNVVVTFASFHGNGTFVGGGNSVQVSTDAFGHASARYTCGAVSDVYLIRADFQGNLSTPADFIAESQEAGTGPTAVSGVVLDQNLRALPNVLVRISGQQTRTGDNGRFRIENVVSGPHQLLEIIGRDQTTLPGRWPNISYDLDVLPGIENSLGRPLFLPKVNEGVDLPLDGNGVVTQDVTYELPVVGGEPPVRVTARAGTHVTFPPDVTNKKLSVTRIATNRVPMVLEEGRSSNLYISVQPSGAVFDQPLEISFPNADHLAAGSEALLMSFDHDAGRYVKVGTAHVSADGKRVVSDPGNGIHVGAWHAAPPPEPDAEVTVLGHVQVANNPTFKNKVILDAEAWVEGTRAVLLTTGDEAPVWSFRATFTVPEDEGPRVAKMEATFHAVPLDTEPEIQQVDSDGNPVAGSRPPVDTRVPLVSSLSSPYQSSPFAGSNSKREQSNHVRKGGREFSLLQSSLADPKYGGTTDENSDHFWIQIDPQTVAGYDVRKYEWKVSGPGASSYTPPPPSAAARVWQFGKVNPYPGILEIKCVMTVRRGFRIPGNKIESRVKRIPIGVTTDDVLVIGWINPDGVSLTGEGMDSYMLSFYPLDGAASMTATQKGLTFAHLATLTSAGFLGSDRTVHPVQARAMTPSEKRHVLNWMFKFGGNFCSKNRCPPTSFASNEAIQSFKDQQPASYKLFNRYQVKYLVENGSFQLDPLAIRFDAETGVTKDPLFDSDQHGPWGPANKRDENLGNRTYLINDGTPIQSAVYAFDALMYPKKWNHIGSRIEFGIAYGALKRVYNQVYPTYYIFDNRVLTATRPQAPEPVGNFNTNPYPPGPAPYIP